MTTTMIPAGYLAKRIRTSPEWLANTQVDDIYSLSGCLSEYFADYIPYWRHNAYWLFDSPLIIRDLAEAQRLSLADCVFFYYEYYELQFHENNGAWTRFEPEASLPLNVAPPGDLKLQGYDITSFTGQTGPECSPLSCNGLAGKITTNRHCLLDALEDAVRQLENNRFRHCEPGPYRIAAVYS